MLISHGIFNRFISNFSMIFSLSAVAFSTSFVKFSWKVNYVASIKIEFLKETFILSGIYVLFLQRCIQALHIINNSFSKDADNFQPFMTHNMMINNFSFFKLLLTFLNTQDWIFTRSVYSSIPFHCQSWRTFGLAFLEIRKKKMLKIKSVRNFWLYGVCRHMLVCNFYIYWQLYGKTKDRDI